MSMTLVAAKTYVAQVIGGQNDPKLLDRAADSITATYAKWNALHNWDFTLKDNTQDYALAGCVIAGDTLTVTHATAGALFFVNVGQTVTGSGILPDTTVASVTKVENAGVTAFTLSQAATPATVEITFSKHIPLTVGTDQYNLPSDFMQPYTARLLTNPDYLELVQRREIDRVAPLQTDNGIPTHYSIYSNQTFDVESQHSQLTVFPASSVSDSIILRYYRSLNPAATYIDVPDDMLYTFLDDARVNLLISKNAADARLPLLQEQVQNGLRRVIAHDEELEEQDVRWISQNEMGSRHNRNYDSNGWIY